MRPHVVAFYSYRGGVGRTTALCNVAARMMFQGDRVLVIDLDFQAPGASIVLGGSTFADESVVGLAEVISELEPQRRRILFGDLPRVNFSKCVRNMTLSGKPFWLMPAGRLDDRYPGTAEAIDPSALYVIKPKVIENLFTQLRAFVDAGPWHYVLVDCRPGLTATSLLAVSLLADSVVMLFGLDRQSLKGIEWTRTTFHRLNKVVHLVASRVPNREDVRQALDNASRSWEDRVQATLQFDDSMLLNERIVAPTEKTQLARDYDFLAKLIRHPNDVVSLIQDGKRLLGEAGQEALARAKFQHALNQDSKDPRALTAMANYYLTTGSLGLALEHLEGAIIHDPGYPEMWQVADALVARQLPEELTARLQALYEKAPGGAVTSKSIISRLAQFSGDIRRALDSPEPERQQLVSATLAGAAQFASGSPEIWKEVILRIPFPSSVPEERVMLAEWLTLFAPTDQLAVFLELLGQRFDTLTKNVSGVVTRFGHGGFGFIASDDGQIDIYFNRYNCTSYGIDSSDFISIGESVVFDLQHNDGKWWAQNVRFPSLEPA